VTPHDEEYWLSRARAGKIPVHVGIIMDGNGRWARARGMPRQEGHRAGVESIRRCLPALLEVGTRYCTLYAFSTENWKRPREEVDFLMNLIIEYSRSDRKKLVENGIRIVPIGRWRELPVSSVQSLWKIAEDTKGGTKLTVFLAVNYGGRQEILDAAIKFARDMKLQRSRLDFERITTEDFAAYLYTSGAPDPDLIIRTSGEKRLSNFLLWQAAYSEFVFTEVLWPDFGPVDLYKAIVEYSGRRRRFGDVEEKKG